MVWHCGKTDKWICDTCGCGYKDSDKARECEARHLVNGF